MRNGAVWTQKLDSLEPVRKLDNQLKFGRILNGDTVFRSFSFRAETSDHDSGRPGTYLAGNKIQV
ncbi:hypothetical protein MASR1M36_18020 [Candidatus Cloacimonadaceae bacterium]